MTQDVYMGRRVVHPSASLALEELLAVRGSGVADNRNVTVNALDGIVVDNGGQ